MRPLQIILSVRHFIVLCVKESQYLSEQRAGEERRRGRPRWGPRALGTLTVSRRWPPTLPQTGQVTINNISSSFRVPSLCMFFTFLMNFPAKLVSLYLPLTLSICFILLLMTKCACFIKISSCFYEIIWSLDDNQKITSQLTFQVHCSENCVSLLTIMLNKIDE